MQAPTAGTRRAVICSERFIQWQQQLSSSRRGPYGNRRQIDVSNTQRKESKSNLNGFEDQRNMDGELGIHDKCSMDVLKVRARRLSQVQDQESPGCRKVEKDVSPECHNDDLISVKESIVCDDEYIGKTFEKNRKGQKANPQQQEQAQEQYEPVSALAIVKRRRRQTSNRDQELGSSPRGAVENANISKRSTRLLTRTLHTEEPPTAPLKFPKIHVVLSRKEVQEDWFKMTGQRYTGKPKKSSLTHLGLGLCTSMTCSSTLRRYLSDT
ncbi:hypothetical protein KP509_36G016100 [Ceratopteris richardii]|uniref:Uncharacterized protein n=1 Tax=Ceratopteris richardii TaxID=49495 RepID=A0A8T2Q9R8_CERRI|nr:hypothetical protein KP509_36G016100 [Ceratopteris richardii]